MKIPCVTCKTHFRVRNIKRVKKPFQCKSCNPPNGKGWTEEEVETLVKLATSTTMSMRKIADRLDMYPDKISSKIKKLHLKRPKTVNSFGEKRSANGIIKVKVAKISIGKKRRRKQERLIWVSLKDLTWFVHVGVIPEGYRVIIKDMKKPQDSIENLDIVAI